MQVTCFKKVPAAGGAPEKWVYLDTRRPHTHDVRAMLVVKPPASDALLLTGGNDAQLFAFSVPHFQTVSTILLLLRLKIGIVSDCGVTICRCTCVLYACGLAL